MRSQFKRQLCIIKIIASITILVLCFCLGGKVTAAEVIESGTCGKNAEWSLDSEGVLTISGKGSINDCSPNGFDIPWSPGKIYKIIIEDGITTIREN